MFKYVTIPTIICQKENVFIGKCFLVSILSMLPWQHIQIFSTKLYVKVFLDFKKSHNVLIDADISVKFMLKTLGNSWINTANLDRFEMIYQSDLSKKCI